MIKKMYKTNPVNNRTKYYIVELSVNLFNKYTVERTYGSVRNKSYTGKIIKEYENQALAIQDFNKTVSLKLKKGYSLSV